MGHGIAHNFFFFFFDNLHGIFVNSRVLLLILDVPFDCWANCEVISSLHLLTSLRLIPLISMSLVSTNYELKKKSLHLRLPWPNKIFMVVCVCQRKKPCIEYRKYRMAFLYIKKKNVNIKWWIINWRAFHTARSHLFLRYTHK